MLHRFFVTLSASAALVGARTAFSHITITSVRCPVDAAVLCALSCVAPFTSRPLNAAFSLSR
ncbi:hypothetical protein IAD21_01605 [Abditibacteriota bacterium]|nr:hypothetical protein IAD21_01605 [Abditibacteriota bacterium]